MLEKLRGVLTQHGRISGILIDDTDDLPSSSAFRNRFGSLVSAYRLIGYSPEIDYGFIEINRQIRQRNPQIVAEVIEKIRQTGSTVTVDEKTDLLLVNGEWTASLVLCRHQETGAGAARWVIRLDEGLKPDITIAVRLAEGNQSILDYYLLPALDMTWGHLRFAEENGVYSMPINSDPRLFLPDGREMPGRGGGMKEEIKVIPIESIRILNPGIGTEGSSKPSCKV